MANYCLRACPDYLEAAGHGEDLGSALFRPVKNNSTGGTVEGAITADGIYRMVKHYAKRLGVNIEGFGAHSLRATAATNALDHEADIAKVQEWLGHANIATNTEGRPGEINRQCSRCWRTPADTRYRCRAVRMPIFTMRTGA